jgi:hypothetical protein
MYIALLVLLLVAGGFTAYRGVRRGKKLLRAAGILIGAGTVLFYVFMDFWGEALWFDSLGYSQRFWTMVLSKAGSALAGGFLGWLFLLIPARSISNRTESPAGRVSKNEAFNLKSADKCLSPQVPKNKPKSRPLNFECNEYPSLMIYLKRMQGEKR